MKKIIISFLVLTVFAFGFIVCVSAQSSENDLDQVELIKQFEGTWILETGGDSTAVWEVIPVGNGYEQTLLWKAKGETYHTDKGLIGLTADGYVGMFFLWSYKAGLSTDYGKFESEKLLTLERFDMEHKHVSSILKYHLPTPDKIKLIWKRRGTKESWDDAVVSEWIWTRVKK